MAEGSGLLSSDLYVRRMGRKPRVKDHNLLGMLKTASLDFEEDRQGSFKISQMITILPIRRIINQSRDLPGQCYATALQQLLWLRQCNEQLVCYE